MKGRFREIEQNHPNAVRAVEFSAAVISFRSAYKIAHEILKHHQDAEDAAQNAMLKVHRSREKFEGRSAEFTWFYRIVVNAALDLYRAKQNRSAKHSEDLIMDVPDLSPDTDPEAHLMQKEAIQLARELLSRLSSTERQVVVKFVIEKKSHPEIAKELGIPVGTSKNHLFRALKKLR